MAKGGPVHVERTEEGGPADLARVLEIEAEAGEGVRRPRRQRRHGGGKASTLEEV